MSVLNVLFCLFVFVCFLSLFPLCLSLVFYFFFSIVFIITLILYIHFHFQWRNGRWGSRNKTVFKFYYFVLHQLNFIFKFCNLNFNIPNNIRTACSIKYYKNEVQRESLWNIEMKPFNLKMSCCGCCCCDIFSSKKLFNN